jgi:hypothetical protein
MTKEWPFTLGFLRKTGEFQGQMVPKDAHESDKIGIDVLPGGIAKGSSDDC